MNLNDREAKEVVDPSIRAMRCALGLSHWRVAVQYGALETGILGTCHVRSPHQAATITLDPAQHDDADELLDTLRHELLHVLHGYFDVARRLTKELVMGDQMDAIDVGFELGAERTVAAVERLLDDFEITPAVLVERGRMMLDQQEGRDGDGSPDA